MEDLFGTKHMSVASFFLDKWGTTLSKRSKPGQVGVSFSSIYYLFEKQKGKREYFRRGFACKEHRGCL